MLHFRILHKNTTRSTWLSHFLWSFTLLYINFFLSFEKKGSNQAFCTLHSNQKVRFSSYKHTIWMVGSCNNISIHSYFNSQMVIYVFLFLDRMSPHKPKDEDEEDTSNVNEFHGHPLLVKTDMTEEMAYDVSI